MIKQTDKGGIVVIMTKKYYHDMVMEHLLDHSTYTEANDEDPDKRVMEIVKEYADEYTPDVLTESSSKLRPGSQSQKCPQQCTSQRELRQQQQQQISKATCVFYVVMIVRLLEGQSVRGSENH